MPDTAALQTFKMNLVWFVATILKACSTILHSFQMSDERDIGSVIKNPSCHLAHGRCDASTLVACRVAMIHCFFECGFGRVMLSNDDRSLPTSPPGCQCSLQKGVLLVPQLVGMRVWSWWCERAIQVITHTPVFNNLGCFSKSSRPVNS